jgi:hypothetical protein
MEDKEKVKLIEAIIKDWKLQHKQSVLRTTGVLEGLMIEAFNKINDVICI